MSVQRVVRAFNVRGPVPEYHEQQMRHLQQHWPELYLSLQELTNEYFNDQVKE